MQRNTPNPAIDSALKSPVVAERAVTLWLTAIGLAATGTWLLFDAAPGLNWFLVTLLIAAGLFTVTWRKTRGHSFQRDWLPVALAIVLAGGAVLTSNGFFHLWIALGVFTQFAILTLLNAGLPAERLGPARTAFAPLPALRLVCLEATYRSDTEARALLRNERNYRTLRGIALALPIVALFFLLLGAADPTLAAWRDALGELLGDSSMIGRLLLFALLFTALLGLYGIALRAPPVSALDPLRQPRAALTDVERTIVLGSVAALFGLFLGLQVSYLFGNPGETPGSGLTFAEALHRGFGEITIVVTLCAWLIIALDRHAIRGTREPVVRVLEVLVVAACALLLASAYHRLVSYEAAYGYTTLRLYVAIYIAAAAMALALLAWEIWRGIDLVRLTRRIMVVAVLALCTPIYWNSAAWVVRQNLARRHSTDNIDTAYWPNGLSADAVPEIVAALPLLPRAQAEELARNLKQRYTSLSDPAGKHSRWYEWNLRREAARSALQSLPSLNVPLAPASLPPATPQRAPPRSPEPARSVSAADATPVP